MEINSNSPKQNTTSTMGLGNAQRPGEYLRQVRIAQRKELSDIAKDLKISEGQLKSLESDDYQSLPEAPFIKGYYRSYAKYLNTDATPLIQRFDEIYASDTGRTSTHALKDSPIKTMGRLASSGRRGMNKWLKRLLTFFVSLGLFFAIWSFLSNWMNQREVQEVEVSEFGQNSLEVLPMGVEANATGDQLVLEFARPTSLLIQDSTGKTLAQGRQSEALTLQGQAPFSIRLDDAGAVKLKLNNEAIGLSSYTNASGTADFRLSP